jgi:hypothetical protein
VIDKKSKTSNLRNLSLSFSFTALAIVLVFAAEAPGQASVSTASNVPFRIGERLTYKVSFDRYPNAGYAEFHVVSKGKIGERAAVELRSRFKTLGLFSAASLLVDETTTTFASPETGLPLYVKRADLTGGVPKETIANFLDAPSQNFDLLSMLYRIRYSSGGGSATLTDNGRTFLVNFTSSPGERLVTNVGEFGTLLLNVQSEFFTTIGITDLRINVSDDQNRIPVLFRFRAKNGEFIAVIASSYIPSPEPDVRPTPTPFAQPTPVPTPVPTPTPVVYIDNQPLPNELAFELGERLLFSISVGGKPVGEIVFEAKERKQFQGEDSLLLSAKVTRVSPGEFGFVAGDSIITQVDPSTLSPYQAEIRFSGPLGMFSQTAVFGPRTTSVTFGGTNRVDTPVNTHSVLSLFYAMRSFNLRPSRDPSNPVNDTRVAVFWTDQPYIFTLRPSEMEITTVQGEKVGAQEIAIVTGNAQLDRLSPKVWLGTDSRRVPLRFSLGQYNFDLIASSIVSPE